ncbi:MAG TPA: hypothetical protein PK289_01295 [Bacteroidia bacterium]|jgi:hypothetical protein|nr:hypothetical protein [Bacteroidia bacterium]HRG52576.1 hypothetical protein [Bacteroidia bacterium]
MNSEFQDVLKTLSPQFGEDIDVQAILFLIGVQELGKGKVKLSKNEKLDIMHIAICTLLSPYGFYEYKGIDEEGWPHWQVNEKLPPLKPLQQETLIKEAIVEYFKTNQLI